MPDPLPVPDYDRLPVGEVLARVRELDRDAVRAVRAHEREHAARPAVLIALAARAEELDSATD